MKAYFGENKNLINILLVYFFLTFAIGYIDFDRRVETFKQASVYLEQVALSKFGPPMVSRILVPYTLYSLHRVSHVPLDYLYALSRFLLYFLSFALFHIYLKKWFDDKTAMVGTLSLIASLPLTLTNWYSVPTDMPELITFILGAIWIRDNKYKLLFFLIPIAALNRETAVVLVLIYFLNGLGREKRSVLLRRTAAYFLCWLVPFSILGFVFGFKSPTPVTDFQRNCAGLLEMFKSPNPYNQYYFVLYLCGFYWILALRDFNKKDLFLRRASLVIPPFFLYAFLKVGCISEVRMFIPFYVFVIPLGLFSLFKEDRDRLLNASKLQEPWQR